MSSDELFLVELAAALDEARLEALVVGGAAAVLQGAPIMTQDVDLLVRSTPRNLEKIADLARLLGGGRLTPVSPLSDVVTLVGPRVPVDLLFDRLPGGLTFERLRARAEQVPVGDRRVLTASLADVIRSKEKSNRPKDRAQLVILREALRVRRALKRPRSG